MTDHAIPTGGGSAASIAMEVFGDVLVAHTPDELNSETVSGFRHAVRAPIAEGRNRVVVNMDRTEAFDSLGLEGLLDLRDDVRAAGGQTKVSGLSEIGRSVFQITRMDQSFETFPSVLDAVSSFVSLR